MQLQSRKSIGFTLIEILVGLTITALIFGGGYATYRDFVRREALNSAYDELATNLNLAKQRALSGEKPAGCTATLSGYEVRFAQDQYSVVAVCGSTRTTVKDVRLPEGVTVSGQTILYKVLGTGTNLGEETTITLEQSGTGETRETTVTVEGTIR